MVLNWESFRPLGDVLKRLGYILLVTPGRWELPASSGWGPGMLLNVVCYTGQPPPQRMARSQMSVVPGKKPRSRSCHHLGFLGSSKKCLEGELQG